MQTNLPTDEQLRDATSQQLDTWAAVLVMGWEYTNKKRMFNQRPPEFSLDAGHALELMHKLATEKSVSGRGLIWRTTLEHGLWHVQMLVDYAPDGYVLASGDRSDWLPTAICLAAIRYRLQAGIFTEGQLASLALFNEQTQEVR